MKNMVISLHTYFIARWPVFFSLCFFLNRRMNVLKWISIHQTIPKIINLPSHSFLSILIHCYYLHKLTHNISFLKLKWCSHPQNQFKKYSSMYNTSNNTYAAISHFLFGELLLWLWVIVCNRICVDLNRGGVSGISKRKANILFHVSLQNSLDSTVI